MLFGDEGLDEALDLVADLADFLDGASFGIGQGPVEALETGDIGTLIPATHGDEHLGVSRELRCEFLRPGIVEIHSDLAHDLDDDRMNVLGGLSSGGDGVGLLRVGGPVEKCG